MGIEFPKVDLDNVKGVLLDIDNTLYPYDPAHKVAIQACHGAFEGRFGVIPIDGFEEEYTGKRSEVIQRLSPQGACRSRLFAFHQMFIDRDVPHAFKVAYEFERIYWGTFIESMKLDSRALKLLEECKSRSIATCAVSDMQAHYQVEKLQALRVDHLIDFLVTSEEAGKEKPAPKIYQMALDRLGLKASEVIMIGDHEEKDILGAEKLGIQSYKVRTPAVA